MAAVYTTGTQAATASPAAGLQTLINTAITAHPNWTLVDTVTTAVTAGTAKVYKCSGSGANANSFGVDFYLATWVATAAPLVLNVMLMEDYNATTHLATRAVRGAGANTATVPTTGAGFVSDNTAVTLDAASTNPQRFALTFDATANWQWGIQVSKSRLHFTSMSASSGVNRPSFIGGYYVLNPRQLAGLATMTPLFGSSSPSSTSLLAIVGSSGGSAYFSRAALSGTTYSSTLSLLMSSANAVGVISTSGAIADPIENTLRGTGVLACGLLGPTSVAAAGWGFTRGSLPGAVAFFQVSNAAPAPTDLVVLSDATRLMGMGAGQAGVYLNVDSDY